MGACHTFAHYKLTLQVSIAAVDVIPLFFRGSPDLQIKEKDLIISNLLSTSEEQTASLTRVSIEHVPTSISVQSSGII